MQSAPGWCCAACTYKNPVNRMSCDMCSTPRPVTPIASYTHPTTSSHSNTHSHQSAPQPSQPSQHSSWSTHSHHPPPAAVVAPPPPSYAPESKAKDEEDSGSQFVIPRIPEFGGLPVGPVVGSYGGGDAMQISIQLLMMSRPPEVFPLHIRDKIPGCVNRVLEIQNTTPVDERIAKLPRAVDSMSSWNYSCSFQISSHVPGEHIFNLLYHGWLFEYLVKDHERFGAVEFPLIGLFDVEGIIEQSTDDPAWAGINNLKWAEQHVHKVDGIGDNQWHFGANMAKFLIDLQNPMVSFWAVAVDIETKRINATFFILVSPEFEDKTERLLRKSAPENGRTLESFFKTLEETFNKELSRHQLRSIKRVLLPDHED